MRAGDAWKFLPERTIDRKAQITELVIGEDLRADALNGLPVQGEGSRLVVLEVRVKPRQVTDLVRLAVFAVADLVALVAEALPHFHEVPGAVDELHLAAAPGSFRLVTIQM